MAQKATAIWRGTGRDGSGTLRTASGALADVPYSAKTRFEGQPGTNPEELIAAAHAGCFAMALAFGLQSAGHAPERLQRSALTLVARIPNLEQAEFLELARAAEKGCPVSKVLNAEITLDARLEVPEDLI
jgi:osmotically inducible protein OsmC